LDEVENGISASLESTGTKPDLLASVVFSVGALVGKGKITLLANGITSGLTESEIEDLRKGLVSLPRRLGMLNAQVTFVNDGLLVAMAHTDVTAPGTTLAVRCGTSLCGGVDDVGVLGEIGWVGISSNAGIDGRKGRDVRILVRDLISADAFLAVESRMRADHLARSLHQLVMAVSCFHKISRVVLCGSLFAAVDRAAFRKACLQLSARSSALQVSTHFSFSKLEDQRDLAARGIVNMVLEGMIR
jgi:hypothetical protein